MDDSDFLDDIDTPEAEVAAEPKAETPKEPEQPASEPETPVAEQPKPEAAPEPVQADGKPEPGFVPFGAVLDERDKRKRLEAELEDMRKQRQQPQEPAQLPDQFDDDFVPALTQQFEERFYQQTLQMSERFARTQYGNEATDAALAWASKKCDADPYFNAQVKSSGDPVGFAVQQFQRDQIVQSVTPNDFEEFKAWKAAQAGLQQQSAPSAQTPTSAPQPKPPKSLASAPSAGPATQEPVQTDEEMFAETFGRK